MKNRYLSACCAAVATCAVSLLPVAASAQKVGTYTGTSSDGQNISITIGTDSNTGLLQVQGWNYGIAATCSDGSTFNTGWGFGADGTGNDLQGAAGTYVNFFAYDYVQSHFKFSGNNVTGTLTSYTPTFAPVMSGLPKRAIFCTSKSQTFSAKFVVPAEVAAAHAVTPTALSYGGVVSRAK